LGQKAHFGQSGTGRVINFIVGAAYGMSIILQSNGNIVHGRSAYSDEMNTQFVGRLQHNILISG
jgi:hypothetical protein